MYYIIFYPILKLVLIRVQSHSITSLTHISNVCHAIHNIWGL